MTYPSGCINVPVIHKEADRCGTRHSRMENQLSKYQRDAKLNSTDEYFMEFHVECRIHEYSITLITLRYL